MTDIIANILEFFSIILLGYSLHNIKYKINLYFSLLIFYLLPDTIINVFSLNITFDIDFIWCACIFIMFFHLQTKLDLTTSLCTYTCAYFLLMIYQFAFVIFDILILRINSKNNLLLIGAIYSLVIAIFIYRYLNLNKLFTLLFISGKSGKFIIANLYVVATIIALYFHANLTTYYENILFIIVAFALIIICNLLLSNQLGKIKEQELRLNTYAEYLPVFEELIHAVRVRQHNYNNQLQAIAGLLYTHKDYEALSAALKEQFKLTQNSDIPEFILKVNLPVVAGFLYQKSNEAKKLGKKLELEFSSYTLASAVPEYDLIEMFGILIDNALDAISTGCTAHVTVDCNDKHITFTTRNSGKLLTPEDRKHFFTKGYSTKKDKKHSGLGLYQLNQLIKQYSGSSISLWNEENDILFQITV